MRGAYSRTNCAHSDRMQSVLLSWAVPSTEIRYLFAMLIRLVRLPASPETLPALRAELQCSVGA